MNLSYNETFAKFYIFIETPLIEVPLYYKLLRIISSLPFVRF